MNQQQDRMPYKNGEVCEHDRLKRQCDECWLQWENEDLRTAMELLAVEVAWRRKVGYCPNEVFESVSNNQTCRTALTHAGCSPVEMQDRKDTIIAALEAEVRAWRDADARHDLTRNVMGEGHNDEVLAAMRVTDKLRALQ